MHGLPLWWRAVRPMEQRNIGSPNRSLGYSDNDGTKCDHHRKPLSGCPLRLAHVRCMIGQEGQHVRIGIQCCFNVGPIEKRLSEFDGQISQPIFAGKLPVSFLKTKCNCCHHPASKEGPTICTSSKSGSAISNHCICSPLGYTNELSGAHKATFYVSEASVMLSGQSCKLPGQ